MVEIVKKTFVPLKSCTLPLRFNKKLYQMKVTKTKWKFNNKRLSILEEFK